jgi:parvulin-like peptidyl-prolyl isomerase
MRELMRHRFGRGAALPAIAAVCLAAGTACGGGAQVEEAEGLPAVSIDDVEDLHMSSPVAVVNGVEIYRTTYEQILAIMREKLQEGGSGSVEKYIRARVDALERAIDEELLFQEAIRQGYDPDKETLRQAYASRVAKAGSEEIYLAGARKGFLTKSDVLYGLRREICLDRFVKEEVDAGLSLSETDVRAYYDQNPRVFTTPLMVRVGNIFLAAPPEWSVDDRARVLSRISRALERLRDGESFENLALEYSEDEVAHLGGMLGFVKRGSLPEALEEAAFSLGPGETSGIVEGETGYHIVKVYQRRGGRLKLFADVSDEARGRLLSRKRREFLVALVETLRQSAEIERILF